MTTGLGVFILVVGVDNLVLLIDLVFLLVGIETITSRVRAEPLLSAPTIAWQLWGAIGLFSHFFLEK